MIEPDNIDYKKPIGNQNDYRTSSYRGHRILNEKNSTLMKVGNSFPKCICQAVEEHVPLTEQQEQFSWKMADSCVTRNPAINELNFMKRYEDSHFRNPPKPMQIPTSVFRQDYQWNPQTFEENPSSFHFRTAVEPSTNILVNREKPGYAKYLDPSATTNNLTYKEYTPQHLGIALKDNITFWNWNKQQTNVSRRIEPICDRFKSNYCPKRRREYQCLVKNVPHSGLTTETRSNYVKYSNDLNFDISHINNCLIDCDHMPTQSETENMIYGSGNRIQKFVR